MYVVIVMCTAGAFTCTLYMLYFRAGMKAENQPLNLCLKNIQFY